MCVSLSLGCCASKLLYISLDKPTVKQIFVAMLVKGVCRSEGTKTLSTRFMPNKYFILQIQQTLGSVDPLTILFGSNIPCLVLPSPVKLLCLSLSAQPKEGELETKTPISQAIRLLFCVLYSSSESHANSYSFLFHLSFALHLLFYVSSFLSLSSGVAFCMESHLSDITL